MKLTLKQKAFADYYIECGNATEAAIKAGYGKKYAGSNTDKLLKNTKINSYMEERLKILDEKSIATQKEILQYLTSVMRGNEKDQFGLDPSLRDRTDAAKELAKINRMYNKKEETVEKEDDGFLDALNHSAKEDWDDE